MQERGTQILGTWDDHDYGVNDGDSLFEHKDGMRSHFLDFLGEPVDSPRRLDSHSPIHQDYRIDHRN